MALLAGVTKPMKFWRFLSTIKYQFFKTYLKYFHPIKILACINFEMMPLNGLKSVVVYPHDQRRMIASSEYFR